ncbi:hypothetical protein HYH02_006154 [Chlamydomonas schloesseri]|uniref:beta-ketoacyl-[acyl-carrier-protein] synthase I n=1 Tax=Chlamydomonas schloesseri TaxID=2026947 RepID=A0A835WK80_9CHLO|nr:hypothetical protein HYH02_006154 [Chlamydomonas schloesseri]|eukprot:KAG2448803.1 hypothetical protein HYH02_006154 [Chlamydomonas schloesseri]
MNFRHLWKRGGHSSQTTVRAHSTSAPVPEAGFGAVPPLPTRRVVVTGMGLVTPLGVGVAETWRRLLAGDCGLRRLQEADLPEAQRSALSSLPCRVAGLVPEEQFQEAVRRLGLSEESRRSSRFMLLALLAAEEALADARWGPGAATAAGDTGAALQGRAAATAAVTGVGGGGGPSSSSSGSWSEAAARRTGVVVGNGMSCTTEVAEAGALVCGGKQRRVSPFFVPRILPNMAAGAISIRYGLQGPNQAPSTACATGGHALGDAFRIIQRGEAEVMVAGASEACVDAISFTGFSRLKALSTRYNDSPAQASRPFDADRDGFVMGEGAGVLVLEELGHATARGAPIYGEIRGYGLSGDGHHVTHPHPDGAGALLCMRRALAGSGVSAADIAYINAHATSTPAGDAIEQAAIRQLLLRPEAGEGDEVEGSAGGVQAGAEAGAGPGSGAGARAGAEAQRRLARVAVSSTKGATGHLLGAAGAVEAAFALLAIKHRRAPPTLNLVRPEPALLPGLVGAGGIGGGGAAELPSSQRVAALSNSFGFGGTNTCLLLTSM